MHGNALDLESLTLQGQYFSSDEAMTDFGVVIDEVRDLQKTTYWYAPGMTERDIVLSLDLVSGFLAYCRPDRL
jgi:hypothetical protein